MCCVRATLATRWYSGVSNGGERWNQRNNLRFNDQYWKGLQQVWSMLEVELWHDSVTTNKLVVQLCLIFVYMSYTCKKTSSVNVPALISFHSTSLLFLPIHSTKPVERFITVTFHYGKYKMHRGVRQVWDKWDNKNIQNTYHLQASSILQYVWPHLHWMKQSLQIGPSAQQSQ